MLRKIWRFLWHSDSILSWILNIVLAFVIVKFLLYPGIGFVLDTDYPVVAVMSPSMEHNGKDFDRWWGEKEDDYLKLNITKTQFDDFKFINGFNKGDLIVAVGAKNINKGDVLIFQSTLAYPLIHRVVIMNGTYTTRGDNNNGFRDDEIGITEDRVLGKAVFKIPYLGWVKIIFMRLLGYNI